MYEEAVNMRLKCVKKRGTAYWYLQFYAVYFPY